MGYVEERIKYLAAEQWQADKMAHPLTCGSEGCRASLYVDMVEVEASDGSKTHRAVLRCLDDSYIQHFIPKPVIDAFLDRI